LDGLQTGQLVQLLHRFENPVDVPTDGALKDVIIDSPKDCLNCCDFLAQLVSPIIAQKLSKLREQMIDRESEVGAVIFIFFTGGLSDIDILLVVQSKD